MARSAKFFAKLMFRHQLLIKSREASISVLEICKLDLISDIIYFFLINPNIIYLAQFPHIKYQLSQFWAHITYHLSVSPAPCRVMRNCFFAIRKGCNQEFGWDGGSNPLVCNFILKMDKRSRKAARTIIAARRRNRYPPTHPGGFAHGVN